MNKEMTPLEALKQLRSQQIGVNVYADELLDIIEKALEDIDYIKALHENQKHNIEMLIEENRTMKKSFRALAIIKEKQVDVRWCGEILDLTFTYKHTKEEYDLLKEVLG